MNIIYKLENISKQEGPKFYIGSKTKCYVKNGVIFSISTDQPYYGSSANITMINDLKNGDKFVASILEIVDNKDDIISTEDRYIIEENAVSNPLYYNLSQATLNYDYDKTSIVNEYGETILTVRDSKIHYNKRRTSCRSLGFKNISSLIIELYNLRSQGKTYTDIVKLYGKNRHFYERIYRSYEVEDFINTKDIYKDDRSLILKIRELYSKNLSYELISSLLDINFLVFDYLFDNWDLENKHFRCTTELKTKLEVQQEIVSRVNNGESLRKISKDYSISRTTVARYYNNYIQNNLSSSET